LAAQPVRSAAPWGRYRPHAAKAPSAPAGSVLMRYTRRISGAGTVGDAVDDKVIEIDIPQTALGQLLSAKEYAVRVVAASGLQFDRLFKAGAAKQALASIAKECPAHE
jgi:hypothetical protein